MRLILGFIFVASFYSPTSWARLQVVDNQNVESDLPAWISSFTQKIGQASAVADETGYTECAETNEIAGAYLCQHNTQKEMNLALTRASMYVEMRKGEVVKHDDRELAQYIRAVGGHDLRSEDLLEFYNAASKKCEASNGDANICFSAHEKEIFEQLILPLADEDTEFVIITFAIQSSMRPADVVTHEIMHAQYFLQPEFREVIDSFWLNSVSEDDKKIASQNLARYYDVSDELLLKNEFQAYILMAGAERHLLGRLVSKYRPLLMEKLQANGALPVQVEM